MNYTILVLAAYAVIMLLSTVLMTKKEKNIEGFCVGNRNIGWGISALSIAATWIWAPALFTSTENAYTKGFAGLFWFLVPNVLCLILFIPFAKKIREEMPEGITLSGYMYQKYKSEHVKNTYLFQLGALSTLSTGVQLLAGSKILSMLTGIPFWGMTIIMAVIAYSYSQFSGIKASILTDSIQMIFMLVVSICFVLFGIRNGGGIESLMSGLGGFKGDGGSLISTRGIEIFLGFGLPTTVGLISGPFGDQCFWQRAFCVRKDRIGRAFLVGAILFGIVPLSMGVLGFVGAGMGYTAVDTGVINFELIRTLFPEWAVIPFLFMIVSGLLSTIDSNLCAISSLTTDIFKKKTLGKTKFAMVLLLILGIAVANIPKLTVTHLFLMYGTLRAATLLPTIFTLKGVKMKAEGVTAGIISALIIGLPIFAYGNINNIAVYKTAGSLTTVILSGAVALIASRLRGAKNE
jgi:Na+/proline symporter